MSVQSVSLLESKYGLTSYSLKWIALITMIIDHIGAFLYPNLVFLRVIGRIAFPIYAFLIVEGFVHTHDVKKYLVRLFIFALVSEIPFDLVLSGQILEFEHQNVFFTLFAGLFLINLYSKQVTTFEKLVCVLVVMTVGELLQADYGIWGILIIFCFYVFRNKSLEKMISISCIHIFAFGSVQSFAVLAFLPIAFYNGKKGKDMKSFFYGIYPIHLLLLYFIRVLK